VHNVKANNVTYWYFIIRT